MPTIECSESTRPPRTFTITAINKQRRRNQFGRVTDEYHSAWALSTLPPHLQQGLDGTLLQGLGNIIKGNSVDCFGGFGYLGKALNLGAEWAGHHSQSKGWLAAATLESGIVRRYRRVGCATSHYPAVSGPGYPLSHA